MRIGLFEIVPHPTLLGYPKAQFALWKWTKPCPAHFKFGRNREVQARDDFRPGFHTCFPPLSRSAIGLVINPTSTILSKTFWGGRCSCWRFFPGPTALMAHTGYPCHDFPVRRQGNFAICSCQVP